MTRVKVKYISDADGNAVEVIAHKKQEKIETTKNAKSTKGDHFCALCGFISSPIKGCWRVLIRVDSCPFVVQFAPKKTPAPLEGRWRPD